MFASALFAATAMLGVSNVFAQSNSSVVCVAGQCLQGFSNATIGVTLTSPSLGTDVLLLPGQYSSSTNPQLLHDLLTSSSTRSSASPGFNASITSLPLDITLQPGLAIYTESLYSGQVNFAPLPTTRSNSSQSFSASSLSISDNTWITVTSGSSRSRLVLWDSIPDVSQVFGLSNLALVDIQSNACTTPCSSAGVCSASGQCTCPAGFAGSSCETCAPGFFGPNCQPCPANCSSCDEGISGSGRCLVPVVSNLPSSCNCLNGQCNTNGQCTCNAGWTAASNGTACAVCAQGFFLDANGDCSKCQLGCDQCSDGSGICVACASGFTQDANDRTKCDAATSVTSTGTQCPDGSFSNGTACQPCSPSCQTCNGPTSNDCIICANAQFKLNGSCVTTNTNGVCAGSTMVANNNKHECDACPAKCTSCGITGFSVASTIDQAKCTGCLPGFVLSNGQCIGKCPSGTFLDPKDNLTCTACDSTCGACASSSTFCLTCANNMLASNGKCVTSCPSNTFPSSGTCVPCHADCASCSGASFNQCTACPADRPVLSNGRCLPTCSKSQFFDSASSSCKTCSGTGPSACLACASTSQVLRHGSCTTAQCASGSSVVPGLGVCLSDLVAVPQASGTSAATPLPSITGISAPTTVIASSTHLAWWQILLMALGCAFIFVAVLWLYRRRQRKKRAARTAAFAAAKNIGRPNWRWRLAQLGERLFGGRTQTQQERAEHMGLKMLKLRHAEEERHARAMGKFGGPSPLPSYYDSRASSPMPREGEQGKSVYSESLYSQVTGVPPRAPVPRQPVKAPAQMASRFSWTTHASSAASSRKPQTEAQRGTPTPSEPVRHGSAEREKYWLAPSHTGESKNPFRH
ncbi:insulin-like growth factor binding protein [Vararia minispora EC-137]|uniref:Insulin-like growth factor binding protein n=1 Tax=Vararia minispora EC-137 TaxID=1314806 RepID=A0ACB8QTA8_9AGAM|nr:insulin-like growth factor binding protein [Vararia minispora EC-137]